MYIHVGNKKKKGNLYYESYIMAFHHCQILRISILQPIVVLVHSVKPAYYRPCHELCTLEIDRDQVERVFMVLRQSITYRQYTPHTWMATTVHSTAYHSPIPCAIVTYIHTNTGTALYISLYTHYTVLVR